MARGRLLRRRFPDGGTRRDLVRERRGKPFHHPRHAVAAVARRTADAWAGPGMTIAYAEVIGDPIDHSLSPTIHSFWLKALKIEATYGRLTVTRADLPAYVAE